MLRVHGHMNPAKDFRFSFQDLSVTIAPQLGRFRP